MKKYKNLKIEGAILNEKQLEEYLKKISLQHNIGKKSDKLTYPIPQLLENYNIINNYPELQFYDYTKIYNRSIKDKNYHITFSRSEITTDLEIEHSLSQGINVSVVFEEVPAVWKNKKVINGDLNDLRMHDDKGVIVGLKAKGMAKKNFDGFVIR